MSSTDFGVALLGFGTVGSGVYELLERDSASIEAKYGVRFHIRKILVRNATVKRRIPIPANLIASGIHEIITDPKIDIVIEVIGGESPAKDYILDSLKAGKHVVTANKWLFGSNGDRLVERARQANKFLGFAGAVTGFHQLCPSIASSVMIRSLMGIFNGTSNYILTQMEEGKSFDDALMEAQREGYAEADPSEDIDGLDTRNKLVIVTKLAFGEFLDARDISVAGIRQISKLDMQLAKQLGYTVKLLGISRLADDDKLHASVSPCLISNNDPLAGVRGVNNGIQVYDALRGTQGMIASGAGSKPTAMAIFTDLISLARREPILWPAAASGSGRPRLAKIPSPSEYYLRMNVQNHPGVLAKITKVFAKGKINLINVLQRGKEGDAIVPLVLMCGPTDERTIRSAVKELELTKLFDSHLLMRIENSAMYPLGASTSSQLAANV